MFTITFDEREFICGWGAAVTNILITFPIQKVSSHQVIHTLGFISALRQLRNNGIFLLYRGILPPLCQKSLTMSLMFGLNNNFYLFFVNRNIDKHLSKVYGSIISGTLESTIMPFERIQSLLLYNKFNKKYKNMPEALWKLGEEYGAREYYRALTVVLMRNILGSMFFFTLKHEIEDRVLKTSLSSKYQPGVHFINGGIIGSFLSTLFYPLNVLKLTMHTQVGTRHISIFEAAKQVYKEGNTVRNFYRGAYLNCTRAFISWGIINGSFEFYHDLLTK